VCNAVDDLVLEHPLQFASAYLQNDELVVLRAVKKNGDALAWASTRLKDHRDVVLAAVANRGAALQYAASLHRLDPVVARAAVANDGMALGKVANVLTSNRELVLTAVAQNGHAYRFAAESLQKDPDVVRTAVRSRGQVLRLVPSQFKDDVALQLLAGHSCATSAHHFMWLAEATTKTKDSAQCAVETFVSAGVDVPVVDDDFEVAIMRFYGDYLGSLAKSWATIAHDVALPSTRDEVMAELERLIALIELPTQALFTRGRKRDFAEDFDSHAVAYSP